MNDVEIRELQAHIRVLHRRLRDALPVVPGVSKSGVRVLGIIARADPGQVTPTEIASSAEMTSSNVAAALRELDTAGLVRRERAADDARRVAVALTTAGMDAVMEHRSLRVDGFRDTVERTLTDDEQRVLATAIPLLGRLAEAQGERAPRS